MPVNDPTSIDLMGVEKSTGNVVLTIADEVEWWDSATHQRMIDAKVEKYLAYILSGELRAARPDSSERNIVIRLVGKYKPDSDGERYLDDLRVRIAKQGPTFEFWILAGSEMQIIF